MNRLRRCPFCKKEAEDRYPYLGYNDFLDEWILDHRCDEVNAVCITVYGKSEQEVIDKWNGIYEEQTSESL